MASPPVFPTFASTFNMTEAFWLPPTASGPPSRTRTITWDTGKKRSRYYAVDRLKGTFELQLKRCDLAAQVQRSGCLGEMHRFGG